MEKLVEEVTLEWEEIGGGSSLLEETAHSDKKSTQTTVYPDRDILQIRSPDGFNKEFRVVISILLLNVSSKIDLEVEVAFQAVGGGKYVACCFPWGANKLGTQS